MSQVEKKSSADEVIERSIELFGLTPEEISDNNERWMRMKGYKLQPREESIEKSMQISKSSMLDKILKRFREKVNK